MKAVDYPSVMGTLFLEGPVANLFFLYKNYSILLHFIGVVAEVSETDLVLKQSQEN